MKRLILLVAVLVLMLSLGFWASGGRRGLGAALERNPRDADRMARSELPGVASDPGRARVSLWDEATAPHTAAAADEAHDPKALAIAARPRRITGTVIDEAGAPLGDVEMRLELDTLSSFNNWLDDRRTGQVLDRTRTDTGGRFTLDPGGLWLATVIATPEGAPVVRRADCRPGADVRLVVRRGAAIVGLVSDAATRAPVEGAVVRITHGPDADTVVVLTDAAGRFGESGLLAGEGYLNVVPRLHTSARCDLELVAGEELYVELEVASGAELTGIVRDAANGDPIAGAEVSAWEFLGRTVRTDTQGRFVLQGLDSRPGTVVARAPGFGVNEARFGAPPTEVELHLTRGIVVEGRVVSPKLEPMPSCDIVLCSLESDGQLTRRQWRLGRTDRSGRFRFVDVRRDAPLFLQPRVAGFAATGFPCGLPPEVRDVFEVGDLVLRAGAVIQGHVLEMGGTPLAAAHVTLTLQSDAAALGDAAFFLAHRSTTTDQAGHFLLTGLGAGSWQALVLTADDRKVIDELELAEGEQRLDVVLTVPGGTEPPGSELRGKVLANDGRGIGSARISLVFDVALALPPRHTRSDEWGEFVFANVPDQPFELHASAGEEGLRYLPAVQRGLAHDGSIRTITLRVLDTTVHGRVVDSGGAGVSQVCVSTVFEAPPTAWWPALTDAAGRFELPVPSSGEVELAAWRTGELQPNVTPLYIEWRIGRALLGGPAVTARLSAGQREVTLRLP